MDDGWQTSAASMRVQTTTPEEVLADVRALGFPDKDDWLPDCRMQTQLQAALSRLLVTLEGA